MNLLSKLFGPVEEINGRGRCATYLYRWTLFSRESFKVYLHKFVGDDWTRDLHDHPKRFISIGLWGSYVEETPYDGPSPLADWTITRRWRAPWIRTFPALHRHRLMTPYGICWTLVIVLKQEREWGFWHRGKFVPWHEYVNGVEADQMKDCP